MNVSISGSLRHAAILTLLFALSVIGSGSAFAKVTLGVPTLSFSNQTQTSIDVTVTAATPNGAPAGFTLQWMTYADYVLNGSTFFATCDASFAANMNSRFALAAGQSVTVTVGNFNVEPGFSTSCGGPLICGTEYVFRVFAHGNSDFNKSAFSAPYFGPGTTTLPCTSSGSCTLTQGFWKNHPDSWPVDSLFLGGNEYTEAELLQILTTPDGGNGLLILAKQLIAAKLSIAGGSIPDAATASAITDADGLIGSLVVPPIGSDFLAPGPAVTAAASTIDNWLTTNDCGLE